jgi:hypothetical protein
MQNVCNRLDTYSQEDAVHPVRPVHTDQGDVPESGGLADPGVTTDVNATIPSPWAATTAAQTAKTIESGQAADAATTALPLSSLRAAARILVHGALRGAASRCNRVIAMPPPTNPVAGTANPAAGTANPADSADITALAGTTEGATG